MRLKLAPPSSRSIFGQSDQIEKAFDLSRRVKAKIADFCYEENLPLIENAIYLETREKYSDSEKVQVRCLENSGIRPHVKCSCMTLLFGFMYVKRTEGCIWVIGFSTYFRIMCT